VHPVDAVGIRRVLQKVQQETPEHHPLDAATWKRTQRQAALVRARTMEAPACSRTDSQMAVRL
jgi:hypothetical protein